MLYRIKEYVMLSEYSDGGMAKIEFTKVWLSSTFKMDECEASFVLGV